MPTLHEHWLASLEALGLDPAAGEPFYQALIKNYSGSGRVYHSLAHLEALLNWLDNFRTELEAPALVSLAIFYHDAVYSTLRKGNESRSANLARKQLKALGLPQLAIDKVATWILQTADHHGSPLTRDQDLFWFLDFDLSILGAPPEIYVRYAQQIRQEYKLVPDILYHSGRSKILRRMLQSDFLYYTPAFRRSHERQARSNLLAELKRLEVASKLGLE
ncbi:MAG: hypothetical protein ACAI44_04500 [Candidatus Sericytochromatia bacterium]